MSDLPPGEFYGEPGIFDRTEMRLLAAILATSAGGAAINHAISTEHPTVNRPAIIVQSPKHELPGIQVTPTPTVADIMSRLAAHNPEVTRSAPDPTNLPTSEPTDSSAPTFEPLRPDQATSTPTPTDSVIPTALSDRLIDPTATQLIETAPTPFTTPTTTYNPDTPTPQSTTESIESLLERFTKDTSIHLQHIKESPEDVDKSDYDMSIADADQELERIVAITILSLPENVREAFKANYKKIYIARYLNAATEYQPGRVNFNMYDSSGIEPNIAVLEVADGPKYTQSEDDAMQASGLNARNEAVVTIAEKAFTDFSDITAGKITLKAFIDDNPQSIDFNKPQLKEFSNLVYFGNPPDTRPDGFDDDLFKYSLVPRLQAMIVAGLKDRAKQAVQLAKDAGLLNFSHAPLDFD